MQSVDLNSIAGTIRIREQLQYYLDANELKLQKASSIHFVLKTMTISLADKKESIADISATGTIICPSSVGCKLLFIRQICGDMKWFYYISAIQRFYVTSYFQIRIAEISSGMVLVCNMYFLIYIYMLLIERTSLFG